MNKFIRYAFVYGLGAATGAFVTVKLLEDHYANIANEEIQEMKEVFKQKEEELDKTRKPDKKVTHVDFSTAKTDNPYKKLCRDYTKPDLDFLEELSKKYDEEMEKKEHPRDDEDEEDIEEMLPPPNTEVTRDDEVGPYFITGEEFANENLNYEKLTLWYYKKDDTLADDNEEMIDNVACLIGEDALGLFNNIGGEKTVHIRNEKRSADFEIICLDKSYKEEILGVYSSSNEED